MLQQDAATPGGIRHCGSSVLVGGPRDVSELWRRRWMGGPPPEAEPAPFSAFLDMPKQYGKVLKTGIRSF